MLHRFIGRPSQLVCVLILFYFYFVDQDHFCEATTSICFWYRLGVAAVLTAALRHDATSQQQNLEETWPVICWVLCGNPSPVVK